MRTIFHVGHAKTGTTALQAILNASRDALTERGVLYPANPNGSYRNHRLVFADLFEPRQVPRHILKNYAIEELPAAREELSASIRREVAGTRPDCLVMSSESRFGVWKPEQRRGFRAALDALGCAGTEIVAYVRRPSSWYLSAVQQHLRASHEIKPPRMIRLAAALDQFAQDFGEERVHVRAFDRASLAGGDIAEDFVTAFLAGHGVGMAALTRPPIDNETLSAEGFDLVRRWRQAFHPEEANRYFPASNALNRILAVVEARVGPPKPAIDPELGEVIDYCRDDLLVLRDRHGLVLPGYDYARVERGDLSRLPHEPPPIERIVQIDREVQARIAEGLMDTRWAEQDPARRRWLAELPARIEAEERTRRRLAEIGGRGAVRAEVGGELGRLWAPTPLGGRARVATFGGTLAEAVARALGPAWIDEEPVPPGMSAAQGLRRGHGRQSARIGVAPTAAQIDRWTAWAAGEAEPPHDAAPQERRGTLAALRRAAGGADAVLIEPAPGEEAGPAAVEAAADALARTVGRLRRARPGVRVLLALSPPRRGCAPAEAEARAVLRAAVGAACRAAEGAEYVPTYEAGLGEAAAEGALAAEAVVLLAAGSDAAEARPHAAAL